MTTTKKPHTIPSYFELQAVNAYALLLPVIVEAAVEFGVPREARVGQSGPTDATLQTSLVVRDVNYSHDVAVADRAAADSTEGQCNFPAHSVFCHTLQIIL